MLPRHKFVAHRIEKDPYAGTKAHLKLDDLQLKDTSLPINLSLMMSTFHRYSQLERSLECLCRQDWKEFEVLICDDGDDYNLDPIFDKFSPYLRLGIVRRDRKGFHVDPSGGFRSLFPFANGEIWAIMQSELMLWPQACRILYGGHFNRLDGTITHYSIGAPNYDNLELWVALKTYFLSAPQQALIDTVDWHTDLNNLKFLPEFSTAKCGLSNQDNNYWEDQAQFPWWFIGSTSRESKIWDMPEFLGHASIDFYLLGYRTRHGFIDIVPFQPYACHQDHHRIAFGVEGEIEEIDKYTK